MIGAITAVFSSWHSEKATAYREINHIDAKLGTAVTIQSMWPWQQAQQGVGNKGHCKKNPGK